MDAFTPNPSYCPVNYNFSISPTIANNSVIVFDSSARKFTIKSDDLNLASSYVISVNALLPNNLAIF